MTKTKRREERALPTRARAARDNTPQEEGAIRTRHLARARGLDEGAGEHSLRGEVRGRAVEAAA